MSSAPPEFDTPGDAMSQAQNLTDREEAILDFERHWAVEDALVSKQDRIRERFGISRSWYYRLLTQVMMKPAAERYDPLLVRRWRRNHAAAPAKTTAWVRSRGGRAATTQRNDIP